MSDNELAVFLLMFSAAFAIVGWFLPPYLRRRDADKKTGHK